MTGLLLVLVGIQGVNRRNADAVISQFQRSDKLCLVEGVAKLCSVHDTPNYVGYLYFINCGDVSVPEIIAWHFRNGKFIIGDDGKSSKILSMGIRTFLARSALALRLESPILSRDQVGIDVETSGRSFPDILENELESELLPPNPAFFLLDFGSAYPRPLVDLSNTQLAISNNRIGDDKKSYDEFSIKLNRFASLVFILLGFFFVGWGYGWWNGIYDYPNGTRAWIYADIMLLVGVIFWVVGIIGVLHWIGEAC